MTTQSDQANGNSFEERRWAAEEAALQLGWLCECPFHGEPFKAPVEPASQDLTAQTVRDDDELLVLARRVSRAYAEQCPLCARENDLPE